MGKGGNATVSFTTKQKSDEDASTSSLDRERKEKMNKAPQFHWASSDSMEEPHVRRSVSNVLDVYFRVVHHACTHI